MNSDSSAYHAKLKRMVEAQSNIKQINEARLASGPEERVNKNAADPQLIGEAKTAMNYVFDMNVNLCNQLSLEVRVAMLNADQRRIFDGVKSSPSPTTAQSFECLLVVLEGLVSRFYSKLSKL